MNIKWIKCSDRMPPKTEDNFIFKDEWGYWYKYVCKGVDYMAGGRSQDRVSYTPFTQAKWEFLNK